MRGEGGEVGTLREGGGDCEGGEVGTVREGGRRSGD